ncbi:MAG: HlyD family efflux transporter periplasmic adaptor subunit, partial [Bryobacterales bacterium]|nr:HlyD family efflux transporter periplasmic adaptor subunit [Bryobacterales bacterium]
MKRWLWIIGVTAVAAAGIFWGMRPQPVAVEATAVRTAPLRVTVEEEGKTRLRSRYVVMAPVMGYMGRIGLKAGDVVRAGAAITMVEPPRPVVLDARTRDQGNARVVAAQAALAVAESRVATQEENIRAARAEMEYWRQQQTREAALQKSGDLPAARVERTVTDLRRAEAAVAAAERMLGTSKVEVDAARAEVASARTAVRGTAGASTGERVAVMAPAAGRVIKVIRESEGVVSAGEALLEVGDARAIEILVEVLSADAVKIVPGMRVLLERWGGPKALEARVRVVEPGGFTKVSALGVEEQRVRVVADLVSPEGEWAALGDGYRVEASFVLWEGANVLQIPANALFRAGEGWAVFVVEGGVA